MSWFCVASGMSDNAKDILRDMVTACSSEASAVAECLNTIAENGEEQASDTFLIGCAEEIRDWAQEFITRMQANAK